MSSAFVGSIPDYYDRYLGPVLFEPYAVDLARRLPADARRVLEIAAGTGRATRRLLAALPAGGELVATDLNEAMLARACAELPDPRARWRAADAQELPFEDSAFDVAVCQFGLMFVPDKLRAVRELRRVVRAGGVALFSTWDELARNGPMHVAHEHAVAALPDDPPLFYLVPFSLPDPEAVCELARAAGFPDVRHETVAALATSESAADLAIGLVRGNPIVQQLAERGLDPLAFERGVAETLAARFGDRPCCARLSAHVFVAR